MSNVASYSFYGHCVDSQTFCCLSAMIWVEHNLLCTCSNIQLIEVTSEKAVSGPSENFPNFPNACSQITT